MLVLTLTLLLATILLLINWNKALHPVEIVLNWMVNAMINEVFILITIVNLDLIQLSNKPVSAITVIIGKIYLVPMITLCFLTLFINLKSTPIKFVLFIISLLIHLTCLYLGEWLGLLKMLHWSYYTSILFYMIILWFNLLVVFSYRKLLVRAGIMNGSINIPKKL